MMIVSGVLDVPLQREDAIHVSIRQQFVQDVYSHLLRGRCDVSRSFDDAFSSVVVFV